MTDDQVQGTRIRSVLRSSRLLMLVASTPEEQRTVATFAKALRTSVPTTYHLLNTLMDAGMLARDGQKHYHLGVNFSVLGQAYNSQTMAPPELTAPLREVNEATGESTFLSAWRGGDIEILAHLRSSHSVQVANLEPGYRGCAHARASGKVLLAFAAPEVRESYLERYPLEQRTAHTITRPEVLDAELARVREVGYATEEEEFTGGVACLAVPVVSQGFLMGTYTLSCPVERYRGSTLPYLEALRAAAKKAEDALIGYDS